MSGPKCVGLSATERELLRQDNALKCDQLLARYARKEHEFRKLSRELEALGEKSAPHGGPTSDELRGTVDEAVKVWLDCDAVNVLEHQLQQLEAALAELHGRLDARATAPAATESAPEAEAPADARAALDLADLKAGKNPSLASFLQSWRARQAPDPADEIWQAKLAQVCARLVQAEPAHDWTPWRQRLEAILHEDDPAQRLSRYEGLVLEASSELKLARQRQAQRGRLFELLDQLAPCRSSEARPLREELDAAAAQRGLLTQGQLESWQSRAEACLQAERERRQRESRRMAILDSLRELGYEATTGMETAWMENGKLVMQKPAEDDYAVELKTDGDANLLQTALVRWGDPDDASRQQQLRDHEEEEAWCRDHAELLAKLRERGYDNAFQFKLNPGEQPVRVIPREGDAARRRETEAPRERFREMP